MAMANGEERTPSQIFREALRVYGRDIGQEAVPENVSRLRMDKAKPFPLGIECYVGVSVGERALQGVVPSHVVRFESECPIIHGLLFKDAGEYFQVKLPPSSMGTYTWQLTREELEAIVF